MTCPELNHSVFDHFIGVDVGKFELTIYDSTTGMTCEIDNTRSAILAFFKDLNSSSTKLVVCDGGCELVLLDSMSELGIAAHRANARQIKSFIASLGIRAKTDAIDARALCLFAQERHKSLKLWAVRDSVQTRLKALVLRRDDLVSTRVSEKNRAKSPDRDKIVIRSCRKLIAVLTLEIDKIEKAIADLVAGSENLTRKHIVLTTMRGIGSLSAWALLAHLPELGTCTRRQVASLAGVAPHPNDSGKTKGYRSTKGGRTPVKRTLFICAMTAIRYDEPLRQTYERLIANGKKKRVALTAVMRRMIVIANARIRDDVVQQLS